MVERTDATPAARGGALSSDQRLLSMAIDGSESATYLTDADWRIVYVNAGFHQLLGHALEHAAGKTPHELLAADPDLAHATLVREGFAEGRSNKGDQLLTLANGGRLWAALNETPIYDDAGILISVIGVLTDITRSKLHESLQRKVLEALVNDEPLEGAMTLLCREVENLVPGTVASVLRIDNAGLIQPLAGPSLPPTYIKALEGLPIGPAVGSCGTAAWRRQAVSVVDIAHDPLWADYKQMIEFTGLQACWSSPIMDSQQRVIGTFAFYFYECRGPTHLDERVVEICTHLCALAMMREESRQHIRHLAFYDALTGLPNRSLLLAQADRTLEWAAQHDVLLAVLFIDLDRFKQVNDQFGHSQGDDWLRMITQRLQGTLESGDLAGRLSGDEFVLIIRRENIDALNVYLERLNNAVREPYVIGQLTMTPGASIGVSLYPDDGHDMVSLLQRADMAMYQTKKGKRGGVSFYREEMNRIAQERMALESALRQALNLEALNLVYQPQVDLRDGRLFGVEALARWHHAEWGEIPPSRFIPLAEECGLIHELSQWVLREACAQLRRWREDGLDVPAISINLSPTDFHNLDLPAVIENALVANQLHGQDLIVEMTENILLDTHPNTQATVNKVHANGIRLAMDDFGTGYSSLGYLRRLPFSELKLDKSFVDDLESNAPSRALSNAVINIGESLNLVVVAEGVESSGQNDILKAQGYHASQGFLFAQPLDPTQFAQWMQARS